MMNDEVRKRSGADRCSTLIVPSIEICCGDRLHGYVIHFSGGWDAWELQPGYRYLKRLGTFSTRIEALAAFTAEHGDDPDFLCVPAPLRAGIDRNGGEDPHG